MERVREEGLAGALCDPGHRGVRGGLRIHTARIVRLSKDLPVVIEIVDTEERIQRVLSVLDEMVGEGMVTLERVEVIAHRASAGGGACGVLTRAILLDRVGGGLGECPCA